MFSHKNSPFTYSSHVVRCLLLMCLDTLQVFQWCAYFSRSLTCFHACSSRSRRGSWVCVYLVPPIRWPQTSAVSHGCTVCCSWSSGSMETLPATVFGTMSLPECAMCSATRSDLKTEIRHSIRGNKSSEIQRPRAHNNSIIQNRSLCSVSSSLDAHQTIKTHGRFWNHALVQVFLYSWIF